MIQKRMSSVLNKIINPNQKGFQKKRFILDHVLSVKTARELNDEGFVAFLDFEKAFDRVNHNLITETLERFGFSKNFILIIIAIIGGTSRIFVRGFFSRKISLSNGVRQGDTISPILFILIIEPLAENIRKDPYCVGLKISKKNTIRVLLFADDVCLLANDQDSLTLMVNHVNNYNNANNGKLNSKKCTIIPMNTNEIRKEILEIPLIGNEQMEKYLGYEFYKDKNKNGIETSIKKFENNLKKWKNLHLSILGRASVIKTYALPIIFYSLSIDQITKSQEKKIENLVRWFLFSYEEKFEETKTYNARISEERCSMKLKEGGLGLTPISIIIKTQKIMWTVRVLQGISKEGWAHSMKEILYESRNKEQEAVIEMAGSVPKNIKKEMKLITIKNILLHWFEIPKKFNTEGMEYVGQRNKKNEIINILKIINKDKLNIKAEVMKKKLEKKVIYITEKNQKEIININEEHLIPISTMEIDGRLIYKKGLNNKLASYNKATFLNGKLISLAESKDITINLINKDVDLTPKQKELEILMGNYIEENFKIIYESKLKMKNKSHCFLRNANALPRDRDKNCIYCPNKRESIEHILYECNTYKKYAKKITIIINKIFKLNIKCDERFLIILDKDVRINIFQMINQKIIWNYRCGMIHEGVTFDDSQWENLIQMELEGFISKEIFLANDYGEIKKLWDPIIEKIDPETKMTTFKKIFQTK